MVRWFLIPAVSALSVCCWMVDGWCCCLASVRRFSFGCALAVLPQSLSTAVILAFILVLPPALSPLLCSAFSAHFGTLQCTNSCRACIYLSIYLRVYTVIVTDTQSLFFIRFLCFCSSAHTGCTRNWFHPANYGLISQSLPHITD